MIRIQTLKQLSIPFAIIACSIFLVTCGGGGSSDTTDNTGVSATSVSGCTGFCAEDENAFLAKTDTNGDVQNDVQKVLAQAAAEARVRGVNATIAVTDRSGNVLAVLRTQFPGVALANNNADDIPRSDPNMASPADILSGRRVVTVGSASEGRTVVGGLEGLAIVPDELAAISKAVTASYLSSEGMAFTTRTASFIIQEHFVPGEADDKEAGPLFGVQFTQLACSDLNNRFVDGVLDGVGPTAVDGTFGPKRSPLGLSADPGGIPLFKFGTPVGGVGVISDGIYGLDRNSLDIDSGVKVQDEAIALAATHGLASPPDRRASLITIDGRLARFADVGFDDLKSDPTKALALIFPIACEIGSTGNSCDVSDANGVVGQLVPVKGYYNPKADPIKDGVRFTADASGFARANTRNAKELLDENDINDIDTFILVDDNGVNRYPPIDSDITDGLTKEDVIAILRNAIKVANRARAQIRRPFGSQMRATVSVVDANGVVLGVSRTRDGPIFGIDTSLQKARTAAFFSNSNAGEELKAIPDIEYLNPDGVGSGKFISFGDTYVGSISTGKGIRGFLHDPKALDNDGTIPNTNGLTGTKAFADRSGGNLSRPFFPDGLEGIQSGTPNQNFGPFSKPFAEWSPFSTGLQLDLVFNNTVQHVLFAAGAPVADVGRNCSGIDRNGKSPLANGIQIFPGSVPIYKNGQLVGGVGVSGDGIEQDDMVSFLGLNNASVELSGTGIGSAGSTIIGNAPKAIRADTINIPNQETGLRYIQCPQSPFIDSDEQRVCNGK